MITEAVFEPMHDHDRLEETALRIFRREVADVDGPPNHNWGKLARQSFSKAKAFLDVSAAVEAGLVSAEPVRPLPPEFTDVDLQILQDDGSWRPLVDAAFGLPVRESVLVDRFAYAPNLPPTHPINQRFRPVDGRSIGERHQPGDAR